MKKTNLINGMTRQEYQRDYYAKHKEEAREYQQAYNRRHGRKGPQSRPIFAVKRPKRDEVVTRSFVMATYDGPLERLFERILSGEQGLTA